jgi:DNA-binding transcriptional regulator YdaS (Cro superfamily)
MIEALRKAVELAGGQSRLAKAIGVRQQHVWNWLNRDGKPAAEYVLQIESAVSGKVTRYELRPDVFGAPPPREDTLALGPLVEFLRDSERAALEDAIRRDDRQSAIRLIEALEVETDVRARLLAAAQVAA